MDYKGASKEYKGSIKGVRWSTPLAFDLSNSYYFCYLKTSFIMLTFAAEYDYPSTSWTK